MTASPPCHNCKKRRHRCDRSRPGCHKCLRRGEDCLGYGPRLRWAPVGTSEAVVRKSKTPDSAVTPLSLGYAPSDPLLQDLDDQAKLYIHHFNTAVCPDLVSFDNENVFNPFRSILTLVRQYDYLKEIVIATSAIHVVSHLRARAESEGQALVHALVARQRAFRLLRKALDNPDGMEQPMLLVAVVFLVNFVLIDSGRGEWKMHMEAAGALIASLARGSHLNVSLGPMCDAILADCLTYHILGSALTLMENPAKVYDHIDVAAVLRRTEAISYHCCPPKILEILLCTSRLCRELAKETQPELLTLASALLESALSFDVETWVHNIQGLSPEDDLVARVSIGTAHKMAAILYILLAVPAMQLQTPLTTQWLTDHILDCLDSVDQNHSLLKGTAWPVFMAGAQLGDLDRRQAILERLSRICFPVPAACPWGYVRNAGQMLTAIWQLRDQEGDTGSAMTWLELLQHLPERGLIV